MAISLLSNLSYLGEDYNFSRDAFATIADMKAFDADYLPPMYLSYCEEDGKVYLYNDNNTEDATTGKWRVFGEGGEGADEIYVGDTQPTDENIKLWLDISEAYDPDYFAKDDIVSISPLQPTTDSNKVWIDITSAKGVLKYKYGDTYKEIGGVSKLSELTDVDLTDIEDGNTLKWSVDNNKWVVGECSTGGGTAEETTYENTSFDDIENVKQALDKLYAKVYYVPLEVATFTITPSTTIYEKGSSVSDVFVTCGFNKSITYMEVFENNVKLCDYDSGKTFKYRSPKISSQLEIKFVATDGESTVTKTVTILFQNKIYWGSSAAVDNYNSSFILALANKKFATSKAGNLSFNVAENEYGFLAMPSSFGSPTCVINNFETELEDLGTISFTNASGYTENYKLYKTTQDSLGAFTATIK